MLPPVPTPRRSRLKVRLAVERDGRLLCVRHAKPDQAPFWCLPGGNVDAGESLRAAGRRELREETGAEVEPLELLMVLDDPDQRGGDGIVEVILHGALIGGEPALGSASGDAYLDRVAWLPLGDLPEDFRPRALRELLHGRTSLDGLGTIPLLDWDAR